MKYSNAKQEKSMERKKKTAKRMEKISIYLHVGEEIEKQRHEHQIQVCCSIGFERFVLAAAEYPVQFYLFIFPLANFT